MRPKSFLPKHGALGHGGKGKGHSNAFEQINKRIKENAFSI